MISAATSSSIKHPLLFLLQVVASSLLLLYETAILIHTRRPQSYCNFQSAIVLLVSQGTSWMAILANFDVQIPAKCDDPG